jgi:ABC-2 type transport system permease protein
MTMGDLYLFGKALRDLVQARKLVPVIGLVLLPLAVALIWRSLVPVGKFVPTQVYDQLARSLVFGFLLVLLACVFGTSVVSQEMEQQTIVYLLTRPMPRWRILLSKFVAALLATALAAGLASLLLALGTQGLHHWGQLPLTRDLLFLALGSLAYGGLFLLLGTVLQRPLLFGLLYVFGIESWLPNLPGSFKMLSLMAYLWVLAPHGRATAPTPANPFLVTAALTPALAWRVVVGVIVISVAGALIAFSTREYVPRQDA